MGASKLPIPHRSSTFQIFLPPTNQVPITMPRTKPPAVSQAVSVFLRLEGRAGGSLQRQIYDGLRAAILAGTFTAGARPPSSRALADIRGVSRPTVVAALGQLQAEGYITPTLASGTFVTTELPGRVLH